MRDERGADVARAGGDMDHPARHAGALRQLGQPQRRHRGQLGRLEHHRVPRRQRRRGTAGGQLERVVPRDHLRAHAPRLAHRVVEHARPERDLTALQASDRARVEVQVADGGGHVGAGLRDRLAGVAALQLGERFHLGLHVARQPRQRAGPHVGHAPVVLDLERPVGVLDELADITRPGDLGERLLRARINRIKGCHYVKSRPASTFSTVPVTADAASDARYSAAAATSSGSTRRPSGRRSPIASSSAPRPKRASIGVRAGPGLMTFTRMRSGASSSASARASPVTPVLAAMYAASPGRGRRAMIDAVTIRLPPPRSRIAGTTAWAARKNAVRLTSSTRSHSARVISVTGFVSAGMPALLWKTSRPPKRSTAVWTTRATSASSVTSAPTASAPSPSQRCASRSTATTLAPASANRRAVARPMPEPAPVTTATLPASPM